MERKVDPKDTVIGDELKKLPKFIPDKIEFKLERCGDLCEFVYREFCTYMPSDVANDILLLTDRAKKPVHEKAIAHLTIAYV